MVDRLRIIAILIIMIEIEIAEKDALALVEPTPTREEDGVEVQSKEEEENSGIVEVTAARVPVRIVPVQVESSTAIDPIVCAVRAVNGTENQVKVDEIVRSSAMAVRVLRRLLLRRLLLRLLMLWLPVVMLLLLLKVVVVEGHRVRKDDRVERKAPVSIVIVIVRQVGNVAPTGQRAKDNLVISVHGTRVRAKTATYGMQTTIETTRSARVLPNGRRRHTDMIVVQYWRRRRAVEDECARMTRQNAARVERRVRRP